MTGLRRRPIVVLGMVALALLAVECTPHRHVHRPKRKRKPKCKTCPSFSMESPASRGVSSRQTPPNPTAPWPNTTTYAVIMAGGVGSRFWPMSRSARPKQFLDILDRGRSLIQMTADRLSPRIPLDRTYIVTNARYKADILAQLPGIPEDQILCEPFMRNTAPCLAYAAHRIAARDASATMVVAPADHLIEDEAGFLAVLEVAVQRASESNQLLTLGITPTRPDTGYGYIQFEDLPGAEDGRMRQVKTFTEKPHLELAEQFLASGDFCWNAGIFVWSVQTILDRFEAQLPDLHALFEERKADLGTDREADAILAIYGAAENISIDYGIMETAPNVGVVLGEYGWSDLGTWGSLV